MDRGECSTPSCSEVTRVVFIGHSFATRFQIYCRAHGLPNAGMDRRDISLSIVGKGGAHIGFIQDAYQRISMSHASKAILQLGGNDLTRLDCRPGQLAKDIINSARQLVQVEGFSHVAICQLCYRYPPSTSACRSTVVRQPLRPSYNVLVDEVNAELRRLVGFFPHLHFWKHRGMLHDYQSLVAHDGIHHGSAGERLYFRSIRGAALFLSRR